MKSKVCRILAAILVVAAIMPFALPMSASAAPLPLAYGAGWVVDTTNTGLKLRANPVIDDAPHLALLYDSDPVVILEHPGTYDGWYHVNFRGIIGYVKSDYIYLAENGNGTREDFSAIGILKGDSGEVNIRIEPKLGSDSLGKYPVGTEMTVIGINNGWYKVDHDGHIGYVSSEYMSIIEGTRASSGSAASSSDSGGGTASQPDNSVPLSSAPPANLTLGQQIVEYALGFLGSSYVYGGMSPSGFDCSGFVSYVYKNFGISINRVAHDQYVNNGVAVDKSELAPGDLVFFASGGGSYVTHVGLYIGNGEFVHASTYSTGVIVSRIDSAYYVSVWHGAKRLI